MSRYLNKVTHRLRVWWATATEMQRDHLRILFWACLLLVAGGTIAFVGQPLWRKLRRDQALAQARQFAAEKDYRSSLLALRRASDLDLTNPAVWKEIADFLAELDSPEVLVARRNQVALAPGDMSLRLALVLDALRHGATDTAKEAVAAVSEAGRRDKDFYRMAAAVSLATGRTDEFQNNLAEVVRRAPEDYEARFELAAFRLWGADPALRRTAAADLRELTAHPESRVRAAVELLKYTAITGSRRDADEIVAFLYQQFFRRPLPSVVGVTMANEPPGWDALVEALKQEAEHRPADAAILARWFGAVGLRREALVWLDRLAPAMRGAPAVRQAAFDLALTADDQTRVRGLLAEEQSIHMPAAAIDLAFAARWQRGNRAEARARATWDDAIALCADSLPALRTSIRVAAAWGYVEGSEAALQAVIAHFPSERWAFEAARISYLRRRDSAQLAQLYKVWAAREPQNRTVRQSWIMLSLLLGDTDEQVHARARRLRQEYPAEPAVAVCYAASLRAQGRPREALAVLHELDPATQRQPRVALWRAVLAAECGRKAEARAALELVQPRELLDEEARLWRAAQESSAGADGQKTS